MDIPAPHSGAPQRATDRCDAHVSGGMSVASSLASTLDQSYMQTFVPAVIKRLNHEPHVIPSHEHLSHSLAVSSILVIDKGLDLKKFNKIDDADSESALADLERKFVRSLAKRGPEAALNGWRLRDEDYEGKLCEREYTPYHLRSVLQLMGLKQLGAHEVTHWTFSFLADICTRLAQQESPKKSRAGLSLSVDADRDREDGGVGAKGPTAVGAQGSAVGETPPLFAMSPPLSPLHTDETMLHLDRFGKEECAVGEGVAPLGTDGCAVGEMGVAPLGTDGCAVGGMGVAPLGTDGCAVGEMGVEDVHEARRRFVVHLTRRQFLMLVRYALVANERCRRTHVKDFVMACQVREHHRGITILFGGTSGCGKSTLASLTASRLGIPTVLSTDFIRHMLRKTYTKEEKPILYASTYNAGLWLVSDAEGRTASQDELVLLGYQQQSQMIFDNLDKVITAYEARREPLIVEGVHLSMESTIELMKRHSTCIPFLVYISNEAKHKERFAVRAKYMALDNSNRYVKYFDNIRVIQDCLVKGADRHLIPKIDNTNVDRSLAMIHATVIKCLRKQFKGALLIDAEKNQATFMHKAYMQYEHDAWSSKAMLKTIRSKASKGEVLKRYFEAVSASKDGNTAVHSHDHDVVRSRSHSADLHDIATDKSPVDDVDAGVCFPQRGSMDATCGACVKERERRNVDVPAGQPHAHTRAKSAAGGAQAVVGEKSVGVGAAWALCEGAGRGHGAGVRGDRDRAAGRSQAEGKSASKSSKTLMRADSSDGDVEDDGEAEAEEEVAAGNGAGVQGVAASAADTREGRDESAGILRDAGAGGAGAPAPAVWGKDVTPAAAQRSVSVWAHEDKGDSATERDASAERQADVLSRTSDEQEPAKRKGSVMSSPSSQTGGMHVQFDIDVGATRVNCAAAAGGGRMNSLSSDGEARPSPLVMRGRREGKWSARRPPKAQSGMGGEAGDKEEDDKGKKGRGRVKRERVKWSWMVQRGVSSGGEEAEQSLRRSFGSAGSDSGVGEGAAAMGSSAGKVDSLDAGEEGVKERAECRKGSGGGEEEEEEDREMSVTSDGDSGTSDDVRGGGTESESESEGPGTHQWEMDSCSWAPSVDVQAEEAHEAPESLVAGTRGSHTHVSSRGSGSKGSRSENEDADDEDPSSPTQTNSGRLSPTVKRKRSLLGGRQPHALRAI